jgi:phosphonate ABC transporter permease subunit PhnE
VNNNNKPSSQSALRRLLVVALVVLGVLVYAYGWRVTDIGLEETQDPTRQDSVTRAMRELLSPDVFDQDRVAEFTDVNVMLGCPADGTPIEQAEVIDGQPYVVLTPECAATGEVIGVEGFGFVPKSDAFLRWIPPTGQSRPLVRTDVDDVGHFRTRFEVPRMRGEQGELHTLEVEVSRPVGLPYFSNTTRTVIEKIIETIFLALMATTVAVPIAAVFSFLAARNLMRQVRLPLGNVLIGFIMLPLGWFLGNLFLSPIARLGVGWGETLWPGLIGPAVAIALYVMLDRFADRFDLSVSSPAYHVRKIGMSLVLLVVSVLVVGALGGLGVWLGERLQVGLLADLGNFVGTLGLLIELMIGLITGLGAAFFFATVGMDLTRDWLKYIKGPASVIAAGILGAIAGMLLFIGIAATANLAALFALLLPVMAAIFGMQIFVMVYDRLTGGKAFVESGAKQTGRIVAAALGALVAFLVAYFYLDTGRGLIDGRLPSSLTWPVLGYEVQALLGKAAVFGAVVGGIGGLLSGTHAAFPLGMVVYNTTRTILNALRSIEPLIMGIVFVIWVGVGPFAGVLALTLHGIAALGKLYSEQTENIDPGPLEAIQATGANRLQTIIYGVIPQIIPPYIAFTMYRWDINVRMSTIIGFVGGGGIGFLLQQQINLLRYRDAGVAVLAIAIVVSVLDYASATIRERIL